MASVCVDLRRVLDNDCPIISYTLVARALGQLPASSPKLTISPFELNHVSTTEHVRLLEHLRTVRVCVLNFERERERVQYEYEYEYSAIIFDSKSAASLSR